MALGPADVYSTAAPGLAQVLSGRNPALDVYRQEIARQAKLRAAEKKASRQKEADIAGKLLSMEADGASPYQEELLQTQQEALAKQLGWYKQAVNGEIPMIEAKSRSLQEQNRVKARASRTKDIDKRRVETMALASDSRYNKDALAEQLSKVLYRTDEEGNPALIPSHQVNPNDFTKAATNPTVYNPTEVVSKFIDELGANEEREYTEAARQGAAGLTRFGQSNIFAYDDKGQPLWTVNSKGERVRKIANLRRFEEAAARDKFMAGLMRQQAEAGQQPMAARLMSLEPGQVSDADLEALNAQTDTGTPHSRQLVADMLRSYGTITEKTRELSPLAVRQPRAGAASQLKPTQATATPTSDFGLSVGDTGVPVEEVVDNPKRNGLLNFLTPKIKRTTTQPQTFNNHYPHVGVSFASEKAPHIPLMVDSNELTTLGADGTTSHYNAHQTNSQVRLNATDRSFVLEVNGKRLGLSKSGTSADAYQELRQLIDDMPPEQARHTVLKAYYQGTVLDKGKVSGDGAGGKAKVLGYKDENGRLLTDEEAAANKRAGQVLTPVYDTRERQLKVMRPATAQLDAQAARQTPGYNPRQRTAQEADLIRRLEAKGGRVSDPYHTTPAAPVPRPDFLKTKSGAATPTAPVNRAGGMLGDYQPPRVENGVKMTGGRKVLGNGWGRGGNVYQPTPGTGGLY